MKDNGNFDWESVKKNFANNVIFIRDLTGYSQPKFAEFIGCSVTYLSDIENRKRNISNKMAFSFSFRLKVTVDELSKEMKEDNPWLIKWNNDNSAFDIYKLQSFNPFSRLYA